jgi:hypothetical protein
MASPNDVPRVSEPIAAAGGYVTSAWLNFFLKLASSQSNEDLAALYAALAARVAELEEGQGFNFQIIGQGAISVNGTPQPGGFVVISLENDVDNPGNTMYYGTGPGGAKGWFPVADAITSTADQIDKSVGPDGVVELGLADSVLDSLALADSALQSIQPGPGISVDNTDPQNPVVSASGGAGGGILPVVTGEVVDGQPVFLIADDGNLIYTEIT